MLRSEYDFDVFHLRLSLVVIVALEVMIIWLGGEIKRLLNSHMLYGCSIHGEATMSIPMCNVPGQVKIATVTFLSTLRRILILLAHAPFILRE